MTGAILTTHVLLFVVTSTAHAQPEVVLLEEQAAVKAHAQEISSLRFASDGRFFASASFDGTVKVWDRTALKDVVVFVHGRSPYAGAVGTPPGKPQENAAVFDVAWSPGGILATGTALRDDIKLWDGVTGKELRTLRGHGRGIYSVAFSPDGSMLASGGKGALNNNVPKLMLT